ncbi:MAG TPA: matrixin family metalloprotease [Acidobacteriota bacterium]
MLLAAAVTAGDAPLRALDARAPIPYHIAAPSESGNREGDPELAEWALRDWERAAGGALRFRKVPEAQALLRLYWVGSGRSQFGEMRPFELGGRRGAAVFVRPGTDGLGGRLAERAFRDRLFRDTIVYLTCVHEIGHGLGLDHTRDFRDIMYFFGYGGDIENYFLRYRRRAHRRADFQGQSGLSQADIERLRQLYPAAHS